MTSLGRRLVESAREASAIAKGDAAPAQVHAPPSVDVRAVRKNLNLSQAAFSERFGLPIGTIRDWEQKRRTPDRPATILLNVIARNPDAVVEALRRG